MHTPESKRDAHLFDLGIDADLLTDFADLPVADLDIPFMRLDLPDVTDIGSSPLEARPASLTSTPSSSARVKGKSVRITIRIPHAVLESFKARAGHPTCSGYQSLMVRALRDWLAGVPGPSTGT